MDHTSYVAENGLDDFVYFAPIFWRQVLDCLSSCFILHYVYRCALVCTYLRILLIVYFDHICVCVCVCVHTPSTHKPSRMTLGTESWSPKGTRRQLSALSSALFYFFLSSLSHTPPTQTHPPTSTLSHTHTHTNSEEERSIVAINAPGPILQIVFDRRWNQFDCLY